MIGTVVGAWTIDAKIGAGAMGEIYRAHRTATPEEIGAVKMLVTELTRDAVFRLRFQSEIDILRQLDHPHIVKLLDSGFHQETPYFVMEYVDGSDYEAILKEREPRRLPWGEVLDLSLQIVPALQHAHRRGIIHRDLKPSNILRATNGKTKLTDFGIAKMFSPPPATSSPQSPMASIIGAVAYAAPEQALGKPLTKRSDFYALGGVLYTLVTGRVPFAGTNVVEVMHKHCFQSPERPSHYVPELPKEFEDLILRLLAKDPGQRPGDGSIIIKEILRIRGELERRELIAPLPAEERVAVLAPLVAAREFDRDADEIAEELSVLTPDTGPLMSRPVVVIPLALVVFGVLIAALVSMFTRPTPEALYAKVEPFLQSTNPEDWEYAWNEALEQLSTTYPTYRTEEIRAVKQRIDAVTAIRRAMAAGQLVAAPTTEAERLFRRGLLLTQAGEFRLAKLWWQDYVIAFGTVESAAVWVECAQLGIDRINDLLAEKPTLRRGLTLINDEGIKRIQSRIDELKHQNDPQAETLQRALGFLHQGE